MRTVLGGGRACSFRGAVLFVLACMAGLVALPLAVRADARHQNVDVLVLGDSQITFGAGPVLLSFFEMMDASCRDFWPLGYGSGLSDQPAVGIIGVRSTSLRSWVSRTDNGKQMLCEVDRKWRVNGGSYGVLNRNENPYIQIGQGEAYEFCESGKSAFEVMFADGYYMPRLLVLTFLGNDAPQWAANPETALQEVQDTMAQLPPDLPCIFMTTPPVYRQESADVRSKAQENIMAAFAAAGSRCSVVAGHTDATLALNVGNPRHFRRQASGAVQDPFHPTREAQTQTLTAISGALCAAIAEQLH
ncbi:MAG: SGNH/GDSL hydrolase family protein [Rhodobacteraceae bacterium]|nr:SGNH/GDSL hydrolase family protein [Paracoccaceae bacterium]